MRGFSLGSMNSMHSELLSYSRTTLAITLNKDNGRSNFIRVFNLWSTTKLFLPQSAKVGSIPGIYDRINQGIGEAQKQESKIQVSSTVRLISNSKHQRNGTVRKPANRIQDGDDAHQFCLNKIISLSHDCIM